MPGGTSLRCQHVHQALDHVIGPGAQQGVEATHANAKDHVLSDQGRHPRVAERRVHHRKDHGIGQEENEQPVHQAEQQRSAEIGRNMEDPIEDDPEDESEHH